MAFLDAQIPSWLAPISPAQKQAIKLQSIDQGVRSGFREGIEMYERQQASELRAREFGMRMKLQEQQLNDIKAFTNDLPKINGWRQSLPADPEEIIKAPIPEGIVSPKSLQFIEGIRTEALKNSQVLRSNSANTLAIKSALDLAERNFAKYPDVSMEIISTIGSDGVLTPEKAQKIGQLGETIRKREVDEQVRINAARRMTPSESMRNSWFRTAEKLMPTNPEAATRIYDIMGAEGRALTQLESDELSGIIKTINAQAQAEKQALELQKIQTRGQNRVGADRSLSPEKWAAMQAELRIATTPQQVDAIVAKYQGTTEEKPAESKAKERTIFDMVREFLGLDQLQPIKPVHTENAPEPSVPQVDELGIPQVPPENVPRGTQSVPDREFNLKNGKLVPVE